MTSWATGAEIWIRIEFARKTLESIAMAIIEMYHIHGQVKKRETPLDNIMTICITQPELNYSQRGGEY